MSQRLQQIQQQLTSQQNFPYTQLKIDILELLHQPNHDEYNHIGPLLVRLAWHQAGTYSKYDQTGGSEGATMRFEKELSDPENNGLKKAQEYLEKIKSKYPQISYSDLWVYASYIALEQMGCPPIQFTPGRKDKESDIYCPPIGRLPDPSKGSDNIRTAFYRMGFNDREIVALIGGGHTLGKCHVENTGYDGPWTEEPIQFSNLFFKELFGEEWNEKKWEGKKQFVNSDEKQMMLPSDMELRDDNKFREISLFYKDNNAQFCEDFSKAYKKLTELGFVQK